MSIKQEDPSIQFGKRIKKYLKYFKLTVADLAGLVGTNTRTIEELIIGDKGTVLRTCGKISNVFGLTYYQFGNPDYPLPAYDTLPLATQQAIIKRKAIGLPNINRDLNLGKHLDELIAKGKLNEPITAKELWALLPEQTRTACKPIDITGLLTKKPRNEKVEKVSKKGKEFLFRVISTK